MKADPTGINPNLLVFKFFSREGKEIINVSLQKNGKRKTKKLLKKNEKPWQPDRLIILQDQDARYPLHIDRLFDLRKTFLNLQHY